ncbi:MAG: ABC transporter substrate-binding protein [Deltaproteobacteria bacterium]|nr:MAG: ABC transporter substrate-binding protein [Deltaproteobacteria bacterium]
MTDRSIIYRCNISCARVFVKITPSGRYSMKKFAQMVLFSMLLILIFPSSPRAKKPLKVGLLRLTSSAPLFIAKEKGYFKQEGANVDFVFFSSAQPIAVASASGDIHIGATGLTAGLYNAMIGGLDIKIIADKGRIWPGYRLVGLMVSNKAWNGGIRNLRDLKGHKVGVTQIGSTFHYIIGRLLESARMPLSSIKVTPLGGVKNMMDTVATNNITTAFMVQPFCTVMEAKKMGHIMLWVSDYFPYQIAAIFAKKSVLGNKDQMIPFMRAYIRGCSYYYENCLRKENGKALKGKNFDEVIGFISKYTHRKPALIQKGLNYNDPLGKLDKKDIQTQVDWFYKNGLIKKKLNAEDIVDTHLWQQAVKGLKGASNN